MNRNWQKRRNFLHELGVSLAKPYMNGQNAIPQSSTTSASLLVPISQADQDSMISSDDETPDTSSPPQKRLKGVPPQVGGRARCYICYANEETSKNNLHRTICCVCRKAACKNIHNRNVCTKCFANKLI